jgi:hypothetical protein
MLQEVTVALRAAREVVEALMFVGRGAGAVRQRNADVREAKRALGLADPRGEAYRCDAVHPLFTPGELHPDNRAALLAAGSDLLGPDLIRRDELAIDATDSSLLLFGSPTSEGLSRAVFGYSEIADREGLSLESPQFDLAYAWELDPEQLGDGRVGRFVPGKGLVERPPWRINNLRGGDVRQFTPQADSEGLICNDYLLITRIPNFLSADAESRGQFIVSFGGAHGTGTRAVDLLFQDRNLMSRVIEELKRRYAAENGLVGGIPSAYQLLFGVSGIKHGRAGSIPKALELIDVVILPDHAETWASARRRLNHDEN